MSTHGIIERKEEGYVELSFIKLRSNSYSLATSVIRAKIALVSVISTMKQFDDLLVKYGGRIHESQGRRLATTPTGPRAIDKEGGVRIKPMKIILASMSRTGTFCEGQPLQQRLKHELTNS